MLRSGGAQPGGAHAADLPFLYLRLHGVLPAPSRRATQRHTSRVPPSWLLDGRVPAVAGRTEPSTVGRIIWVLALRHELPSVEGPVVGMTGSLAARCCVTVVLVGADAARVAGEDAWPEPGLVALAVAALSCAASVLLCLAPVLGASAALVGVLGAPRCGADPPCCSSGHGSPRLCTVSRLGGGSNEAAQRCRGSRRDRSGCGGRFPCGRLDAGGRAGCCSRADGAARCLAREGEVAAELRPAVTAG